MSGAGPSGVDIDLNGKIALVTGASRGLGAGLARRLAGAGADVVITYRRAEEQAHAVADQIRGFGRQAWVLPVEMGETESIEALFTAIDEQVGGLDICVLNAAATSFRPLMKAEMKHLEKTYAISVFGFLRAIQLALPRIEARGGGTILGVSGADTRTWIPSHGILAGAKAAMESMIAYLAMENGDSGVTILGVNPGTIRTESVDVMLGDLAEPLLDEERRSHPMGRLATPDDLAESIVLLTTPAARWAHGTVVNLDGGGVFSMWGRYTREVLKQVKSDRGVDQAGVDQAGVDQAPMAEAVLPSRDSIPDDS